MAAGKRILVVDDEPNICRLMQVNLERQGYVVETVGNGAKALAQIKNSPEKYDLVITDDAVPEMDGHHLAAAIEADPSISGLPVLFLTGKLRDLRTILKR